MQFIKSKSPIQESRSNLNLNSDEQKPVMQELQEQKKRIEERMKRAERHEVDERIIDSLKKMKEISEAIGDLQNALNIIWKRSIQIEEELKLALQIKQ